MYNFLGGIKEVNFSRGLSFNKEMSDLEIKFFQLSKFFACGGLISCFLIKEVSDPEIERFQQNFSPVAGSCDLIKKMPDPGLKRFQSSRFFACGGLISIVLMKEM